MNSRATKGQEPEVSQQIFDILLLTELFLRQSADLSAEVFTKAEALREG